MAKLPITPRPIKYRAFNGKDMMIVQSLCFNHECIVWYGGSPHMGVSYTFDSPSWSEENPRPSEGDLKPVMQWTGLHDLYGVEIFEGDIVEDRNGRRSAVNWISENDGCDWTGFYVESTYAVIGNVFQNPELLKP